MIPTFRLALAAGVAAVATAGIAAVASQAPAGAQGAQPNCPNTPVQRIADGFYQPEERHSVNGELRVTLRASSGKAYISKPDIQSDLFEGQYPGPTLRVCPGDTLRVNLINDLKQPTNLHVHGMHVDPKGHGDNVLAMVPPGTSRSYVYKIPHDQTPGMYWYHPHMHGYTDPQVFRGMAGTLIVEGSKFDDLPGISGVPERVLVVQENQIADGKVVNPNDSTNAKVRMLVNGRLRPKITVTPGELQRWRIVNASADRFIRLRIPGQRLNLIATDGNPLDKTDPEDVVVMGPGERREVLVRGAQGAAKLETLPFKQPFDNTRQQVLADIVGEGAPVLGGKLPDALVRVPDLRKVKVDRKRTIVFQSAFPKFLINGKTFSHHRIDQTMKLNTTEEWTIKNASSEWHVFHIHVNPFQVTKINGKPVDRGSYEDDVPISPHGSVTMRTRFIDFTGKYVIHCHILDHEDGGMMSLVRVIP